MLDFYCKDCGHLVGSVGNDDIIVRCPFCNSLNYLTSTEEENVIVVKKTPGRKKKVQDG